MKLASTGRLSALLLTSLVLCACREPTRPRGEPEIGRLEVAAAVGGTSINTLVVEVTAADIATPLVFNLEVVGGVASGSISIPAGSGRVITAKAFDVGGIQTHEGSVTVSVQAGTANPTVTLTLLPLAGQQAVQLTIGNFSISVTPPSATVAIGGTTTLTAVVTDVSGTPIVGAMVVWATSNPARATVAGGVVTGVTAGSVTIAATYNGKGASASLSVVSP